MAQAAFGCKLRPAFALLAVRGGCQLTYLDIDQRSDAGHGKQESFVLIGLSKSETIDTLTRWGRSGAWPAAGTLLYI